MKIGRNITALRHHHGLSQSAFARKIGVSKTTVSMWEHDKKYPSRRNIEKLTTVFRLDSKELFGPGLQEYLSSQIQFQFHPVVHTIKDGIELVLHLEKLSRADIAAVDKAVALLKVYYS